VGGEGNRERAAEGKGGGRGRWGIVERSDTVGADKGSGEVGNSGAK